MRSICSKPSIAGRRQPKINFKAHFPRHASLGHITSKPNSPQGTNSPQSLILSRHNFSNLTCNSQRAYIFHKANYYKLADFSVEEHDHRICLVYQREVLLRNAFVKFNSINYLRRLKHIIFYYVPNKVGDFNLNNSWRLLHRLFDRDGKDLVTRFVSREFFKELIKLRLLEACRHVIYHS